jgi:hypothetical protein
MFMQVFEDPNVPAADREIAARIAQRLSAVPRTDAPYRHFVADELFDPEFADNLLEWLETKARFVVDEQSFYRFEKCLNLKEILQAENIAPLLRRPVMDVLWDAYERYFEKKLQRDWIFVSVHKMSPGDEIKLHSDPVWAQNFRLVINLIRGYRPQTHGAFFGIAKNANVDTYIASFHGSAIGFELTETAYHSVSQLMKGTRYSVCFGFYREGRGPTDLPTSLE